MFFYIHFIFLIIKIEQHRAHVGTSNLTVYIFDTISNVIVAANKNPKTKNIKSHIHPDNIDGKQRTNKFTEF